MLTDLMTNNSRKTERNSLSHIQNNGMVTESYSVEGDYYMLHLEVMTSLTDVLIILTRM
jgi:hypothetical protein